jgi:hypothetical protein
MGAPTPQGRRTWRDVVAVGSATEALAVALWLWPASVHIVQWPPEGPVRLALLNPMWQLGAWLAAGLVAAAMKLLFVRRVDLAWAMAPMSLLWLCAVPYLPWLPDRLPLLLLLAGPVRWGIAAAALGATALRGLRSARSLARASRPGQATLHDRRSLTSFIGRRAIFVVSLVLYLAFGVLSAKSMALGGDEPHYLVITESLLRDGDLKIENNHRQGDYKSFYQGELRPDFFERGSNGEIYSIHAPGLPVLVIPAYVLGGRIGVVVFIALLAALAALAIFDLCEAIAGRWAAVATWAASCLTVPFIPQAWLIFGHGKRSIGHWPSGCCGASLSDFSRGCIRSSSCSRQSSRLP